MFVYNEPIFFVLYFCKIPLKTLILYMQVVLLTFLFIFTEIHYINNKTNYK